MVSETNVILLKAAHLVVRVLLVLASAFWALICLELLPPLFLNGVDEMRNKLVHIWSIGRVNLPWSCQDSLQLVHEGYTDLFIFLLLTWALLELKRLLHRKMAAASPATECSEATAPKFQ